MKNLMINFKILNLMTIFLHNSQIQNKYFEFFNTILYKKYGFSFYSAFFQALYKDENNNNENIEISFKEIFSKLDKSDISDNIKDFEIKTISDNQYTSGNGKNFVTSFY